ncbi:hypothetical protein [Aeromonas sp. AE23HZ002T15]
MDTVFWPRRAGHRVEMMTLVAPPGMSPGLREDISLVLSMVAGLRQLEEGGAGAAPLKSGLHRALMVQLSDMANRAEEPEVARLLGALAESQGGGEGARLMAARLAQGDEQHLVAHVGPLATWLGKSRQTWMSAFFATPNPELQSWSDCVDAGLQHALPRLCERLCAGLIVLPGCAYKVVDLFAIAGEANGFPKHFAYFMPEDQGIKYAADKRTIVFANTYRQLHLMAGAPLAGWLGWAGRDLPDARELDRYLLGWFRGHDLGHGLVLPQTDYAALSRHDRWGSMVMQEAVADTLGFLLCCDPSIASSLGLERDKLCRFYCLELLRYLRRGPCEFPDAGSAYVQLALLAEQGILWREGESLRIDEHRLERGMWEIAGQLLTHVMGGNVAAFADFSRRYAPHLQPADRDLYFGLGPCDRVLAYHQPLREERQDGIL